MGSHHPGLGLRHRAAGTWARCEALYVPSAGGWLTALHLQPFAQEEGILLRVSAQEQLQHGTGILGATRPEDAGPVIHADLQNRTQRTKARRVQKEAPGQTAWVSVHPHHTPGEACGCHVGFGTMKRHCRLTLRVHPAAYAGTGRTGVLHCSLKSLMGSKVERRTRCVEPELRLLGLLYQGHSGQGFRLQSCPPLVGCGTWELVAKDSPGLIPGPGWQDT